MLVLWFSLQEKSAGQERALASSKGFHAELKKKKRPSRTALQGKSTLCRPDSLAPSPEHMVKGENQP